MKHTNWALAMLMLAGLGAIADVNHPRTIEKREIGRASWG